MMIELIQHKVNYNDLVNPFTKINETSVSMNTEMIQKDIDRFKDELNKSCNKYDKANIEMIITYLKKLKKNINSESQFELCWSTSNTDEIPHTYPVQLVNEPVYKLNTCNYIEIGASEKLVEIDLTDLADIIAFEFMYKDLGETHESIEELLKDCGIIGFESSKLLTDYFKDNGDEIYKLSKIMRIGESPYASPDTKTIKDYFSSKEFKIKDYKDVVEYSCRYAATIIANTIIKNHSHNDKFKLLMVNATTIVFITDVVDDVKIDEITIRVFGRRFIVEPRISII